MGVRETTPLFFFFFSTWNRLRGGYAEDRPSWLERVVQTAIDQPSRFSLSAPKRKTKKKTADCKTRRERKGKRKRFDLIWEERFACNSSLHETKEISFVQRRERVFVDTPALLDRHKDCWCMYTQQCSGSIRSLIEIPLAQHLHSLMRSRNNI